MNSEGKSADECPISADTKIAITNILAHTTELDHAGIQRTIQEIERAVLLAVSIDLPNTPSEPKNELKKLQRAIKRLIQSIKGTSHHAAFEMWDAARGQTEDARLANFDSDGQFGSELAKLRGTAEFVGKAAKLAIDKIEIPRGAAPNVQARHFAFHVAVALEDNGVEPKTTKAGPYYSILAELFSELMPTAEGEAYQTYGCWALKNPTLQETFVHPAYLRNSDFFSD